MKNTGIITDDTLREMKMHGNQDFPFEYYYDDFQKFDNHLVEWHWHNEFEFVSVDSGTIDCLIGMERIQLNQGSGLFVNSGVIHRYESKDGGLLPNILFAPEFIAPKEFAVYKKHVLPVLLSGCDYMVFCNDKHWQKDLLIRLNEIYRVVQMNEPMMEIHIQILISTMWSDFFENIQILFPMKKPTGYITLQSRLHLMLQFISDHYMNRITLEDIANAASISKSEALRCFQKGIQTSPVNYLIEYRLSRAKELLQSTNNTVTDIASAVGFESVSYFSRIFTKSVGMTPKAYRRIVF
mgnify:CR=1 FL=1